VQHDTSCIRRLLPAAALGCALAVLCLGACSSAPRKTDTVSTVKNQAAQDSIAGDAYFRQGRFDLALQLFTKSLNENTTVDNGEGVIQSYIAIGKTSMAMGSLDRAEEILLAARERSRAAGAALLFTSTSSLGELYLAKGEPQKALDLFTEALGMPAAARTKAQTALLYHDIGTAQKDLGQAETALGWYGKALEINLAEKLGDQAAADYYMVASVYSKKGDYDLAAKNAQMALEADKKIENSPGIAQDLYALGLISNRRRDTAAAYDYFQRSYLVFTALGIKPQMRKALAELVGAADALGRTTEAESYRRQLAELGGS
jgi:tetratricopeptide (TPR) repeat protein